jgi:hypothetical protein
MPEEEKLPEGKYLLTSLPDKGWNWNRFSVENLANGTDEDIFFFISALGQALGQVEMSWKKGNKQTKDEILGWMNSCLIHAFSAMCIMENSDRAKLFSALVSFLMNYIECFRMVHRLPSSDVVVRIWAESLKKRKEKKK